MPNSHASAVARRMKREPAAAVQQQHQQGRYSTAEAPIAPNATLPRRGQALPRIDFRTLLRGYFLTSVTSSRLLLRPSLAFLGLVVTSKLAVFDPDRNPFLNWVLRPTIYNHFCSGAKKTDVAKFVGKLRDVRIHGVIVGYAKEIVLRDPSGGEHAANSDGFSRQEASALQMVNEWKEANLKSLEMIGPGDFMAVKLTGAGPIALDAITDMSEMPALVVKALDEICEATKAQGSRIMIDAEQQILQPGIDEWTIQLMRKHNRDGKVLVYNTIQAYLRASKANLDRHIELAATEGWSLGAKLVRDAYIDQEVRTLIHSTKEGTDSSYDLCANTLISQKLPAGTKAERFPHAALFLATHNGPSATKAYAAHQERITAGLPTVELECGQISGMADELSCELIEAYENCAAGTSYGKTVPPRVYKYICWGTVGECMGYLHRRAIENRVTVERTRHMAQALGQEHCRRIFRWRMGV